MSNNDKFNDSAFIIKDAINCSLLMNDFRYKKNRPSATDDLPGIRHLTTDDLEHYKNRSSSMNQKRR